MTSDTQTQRREEISKLLLERFLVHLDSSIVTIIMHTVRQYIVDAYRHINYENPFLELFQVWRVMEKLMIEDLGKLISGGKEDSLSSRVWLIMTLGGSFSPAFHLPNFQKSISVTLPARLSKLFIERSQKAIWIGNHQDFVECLKLYFLDIKGRTKEGQLNFERNPIYDDSIPDTAEFLAQKVDMLMKGSLLDSFRLAFRNYLEGIDILELCNLFNDENRIRDTTVKEVFIDSRSIVHQTLLNVELNNNGGPTQLPIKLIDPNLYEETYQSRTHILRNIPKDNSKKNQKKKAGRKAKKIREIENRNDSDAESEEEVEEAWVTVIDSSLAVFSIDD